MLDELCQLVGLIFFKYLHFVSGQVTVTVLVTVRGRGFIHVWMPLRLRTFNFSFSLLTLQTVMEAPASRGQQVVLPEVITAEVLCLWTMHAGKTDREPLWHRHRWAGGWDSGTCSDWGVSHDPAALQGPPHSAESRKRSRSRGVFSSSVFTWN